MTLRRALQYALPIAAFVAIAALIASVPVFRGYSMEQCFRAYGKARTRGDTARVDLHPAFIERDNRTKHRCGEFRSVMAKDSIPLIPTSPWTIPCEAGASTICLFSGVRSALVAPRSPHD